MDQRGDTIDFYLSSRRNTKSAYAYQIVIEQSKLIGTDKSLIKLSTTKSTTKKPRTKKSPAIKD